MEEKSLDLQKELEETKLLLAAANGEIEKLKDKLQGLTTSAVEMEMCIKVYNGLMHYLVIDPKY